MKVLFVVYSMSGGAGKQLALTANALSECGCEVTIYAYHWNKEPVFVLNESVNYIPEHNIAKNSLAEYVVIPQKIRSLVKSKECDIVIGWRTNAGCLVSLACVGSSVKTVFAERSDPYMENSPKLTIAKFFCNHCDYGVFQTEMARDYYTRLKAHSIVIPNPFAIKDEILQPLPYNIRKKEIIFAGRFNLKQKRQDVALKAFELFHRSHTDYKLIFCGDGEGISCIQQLTNSLGLNDAVVFEGLVSDMKTRARNAKLFILSSDYEGIPNVILEAFAWGIPVVSTDCSPGGARVLIDNGENGYVVPPRDYKSMAERMEYLVDNDDIANSFIEKGLLKLRDFTPNEIFSQWHEFILSITN